MTTLNMVAKERKKAKQEAMVASKERESAHLSYVKVAP